MSTTEIVKAFFFEAAEGHAGGDVRIDVLDSWTNSGLAAVGATGICRQTGPAHRDGLTAANA